MDSSVLKVTNFIFSCFISSISHFVDYIYVVFMVDFFICKPFKLKITLKFAYLDEGRLK